MTSTTRDPAAEFFYDEYLRERVRDISDAIDEFNHKIATSLTLPAHLLDPNAPAPCTALAVTPKCYGCGGPLDRIPATQPALCGDCDNVP